MKKLIFNGLLICSMVLVLSNSGCEPYNPEKGCVRADASYIDTKLCGGTIKHKITDTFEYNWLQYTALDSDLYWVLNTASIQAASSSHPFYGAGDRVVRFTKGNKHFRILPVECCQYFYDGEARRRDSSKIWSFYYDCNLKRYENHTQIIY